MDHAGGEFGLPPPLLRLPTSCFDVDNGLAGGRKGGEFGFGQVVHDRSIGRIPKGLEPQSSIPDRETEKVSPS